ncbi:UNVERIFIED_CONTAM: type IV toxin-antitoxin system AbiEi family antitoxin domain-containing protein [Campylobacter lari]
MNKEIIIKNLLEENNGYLLASEARKMGYSSTFLTYFKRKNKLIKIAKGIYKTEKTNFDELYVINLKSPKVVFMLETALYLHDLIDYQPKKISACVYYNYNATNLKKLNVFVNHVKYDIYELGKTKIKTKNNHYVNCYDLEKTICDLIKYKEIIPEYAFSNA